MPPTESPEDVPSGRSDTGGESVPARVTLPATPITQEQLERVIRRASDLQFRGAATGESQLDSAEVVRIGSEVGIEPRYVRQALAEVQAEALVPDLPAAGGLGHRLAGSGTVRASRVVPGSPEAIERNLSEYLKERELLRPVRTRSGRSLWEPAGGLVSSMRRAMDVGGHGYVLAKARRLQVSVEALEEGFSLVTLTADLSNLRNEAAIGGLVGLGLAGVGTATALIVLTGGAALGIVGGVALFTGGLTAGTAAARAEVRKKRRRMELVLQGLLDRLERGETLDPDGEPWHQRLLR